MSGTLQKKRDGKGVMKYTNGNRFEGEWSNDKIKDGIQKETVKDQERTEKLNLLTDEII